MNKRNITNIKKVLIVVGIVLILILGVLWIIQFVQTDNCLEKGGRWNSSLKECECPHTIDLSRIADYYWKCEYDTTINSEYLNRGTLLDSISKSPNSLIDILNMRSSKSKIKFVELAKDTLIIDILNDTFLTQQMGSLGAYCYMAETVYTLTENKLINFVKFEMNYGSHASPGLYSRGDYERMMKSKALQNLK